MLTLAIVCLIILLIRKRKDKDKSDLLLTLGIVAVIECMTIFRRYNNLFVVSDELVAKKEEVVMIEEQLETLESNFRYVPAEGDTIEKLYSYIDEYETLNNRLTEANSDIVRNERQLDPTSLGNRLIDIFFDFGITKKLLLSKQ